MANLTQDQLNQQLFRVVRQAIYDNNLEAIKEAIDDGAEVNATDAYGKTPLEIAELYKSTEIIDLLKQHGGVSTNALTLPDHISFEEIADKWCEESYDNAIRLRYETYFFVIYKEGLIKLSAVFYPNTRSFEINNEEKFQPLLNFIKERSNV